MPKKCLTFLLPLIVIAGLFLVRVTNFETYRYLVSEDSVLETLQFVFYFLTGVGLLKTARDLYLKKVSKIFVFGFICLAGVFMFVSLEEISWGQRIFNLRNPDFFTTYNVQKEVSVHNLSFFQPYLHSIYILAGIFLGLVIPLARPVVPKKYQHALYDWRFSSYFIPLSLIYIILTIWPPISLTGPNIYGFIWRDQEVGETLLALGLFWWWSSLSSQKISSSLE